MENPPYLTPRADDVAILSEDRAGGVWALVGDRLVALDAPESMGTGAGMVLVPNELVLVLAAELPPIASTLRRRAALPFAIEDRIAEPLGEVHVALGAEIAPRTWLAGVVRHDVMRAWTARLAEAGLARAAIVPDALTLPLPDAGSWAVDVIQGHIPGRAMVRCADGTGFALPLALLEPAWRAAGEPRCLAYGDPLPAPMQVHAGDPIPLRRLPGLPVLDLRQGAYAPPRRAASPLWRRIAGVAAIGAAAHGAIAIADTIALDRIAGRRDAEVRALAASLQPNLVIGADLGSTLSELTPDGAAAAPSPFLSLLSRTGGALAQAKLPVAWRSAEFDRSTATLTIEVEADSIDALQQVAQALTRAGLAAQPGAASTDQGRAVGTFAVHAA